MRALILLLALLCMPALAELKPALTDDDGITLINAGACGSLGIGTGLSLDGRGWVHSPIPGPVEFRITGGAAGVTVARLSRVDMDAGRPYYIQVYSAVPWAQVEWRVPGYLWGRVPKSFLYPSTGPVYAGQLQKVKP